MKAAPGVYPGGFYILLIVTGPASVLETRSRIVLPPTIVTDDGHAKIQQSPFPDRYPVAGR